LGLEAVPTAAESLAAAGEGKPLPFRENAQQVVS